jgi:hypothetical protein
MNTTEAYALLWSKRSNCFHVEPLTETVAKGRRFFLEDMTNDYLLIGLGTNAEVVEAAAAMRPYMVQRDREARKVA